jgi:hypothetical protein
METLLFFTKNILNLNKLQTKTITMIRFKDLPAEIQQRMLDEQVRQGNPRNAEVFEESISATSSDGGFFWVESVDGYDFWGKIIVDGDFSDFYAKYPKRPLLKVIPLHVKILNSKALLEEIAERLVTEWRNGGCMSGRVEVDWFEYGGFYWSANAEIEAEYEVKQFNYDTPPESYCKRMSVEIGAIECTDEGGNPVLVDYFDDERIRIREDDFVRKAIIAMEME